MTRALNQLCDAGARWMHRSGAHYRPSEWIRTGVEPADLVKGALAGMAGGLVASWVMNQYQAASSAVAHKVASGLGVASPNGHHESQDEKDEEESLDEMATVRTAQALATHTLHRPLSKQEKKIAAPAVHYGYGALMGGLYGGLVEAVPAAEAGYGTVYGTALFLGGDEVALPLLGFSGPPTQMPLSTHANALAAHLVYGLATEGVRRLVRQVL